MSSQPATPATPSSSSSSAAAGGGDLESWLTGLDLEDYSPRLKQRGYSSLRFLKAADPAELDATMAEIQMKKPHARVFRAAVAQLRQAAAEDESPWAPSAAAVASPSTAAPTPAAASPSAAASPAASTLARSQRLAQMEAQRTPSIGFVDTSDSDDEELPLVQQRPVPTPVRAAGGDDQPATPASAVATAQSEPPRPAPAPAAAPTAPAPAPAPEPTPELSLKAQVTANPATVPAAPADLAKASGSSIPSRPPSAEARPPSTDGVRAPTPVTFAPASPASGKTPRDSAKALWAGLAAGAQGLGAFASMGTRIADITKGWSIESGFLTFTGASSERSIMNKSAQTAVQAQQGAFLKISGGVNLSKPFNKLPTLLERQKRVRQLLAIVNVMETEWGLAMPPMIVSVTGNAAPFQMRPKYNAIFSQALLKATQSTGAWVTTGGTDAGVMKLAGESMKNSHTPVLGISAWGVIVGRGKLARPSQETIRARIADQITARNDRAPTGDIKNVGSHDAVLRDYALNKAKSWADPQSVPIDIGERLSFLGNQKESADMINTAQSLESVGLISHEGRPDITIKHPYLRTGKCGRGSLGRWGPNHAIDTIVTRRIPTVDRQAKKDAKKDSTAIEKTHMQKSGLQVALQFRRDDQLWSIPGRFLTDSDVRIMSRVSQGQRLTGELPSVESEKDLDRARLSVRENFELEGVPDGKVEYFTDLFDEIFKKSAQTLVYRGYSDDPRNTNESWVETSAWHVHCPAELCNALDAGYEESSRQIMWMDIVVTRQRLEFQDEVGNRYDLFASHRELIELAVFGNVLGNRDMPFEYDGSKQVPDAQVPAKSEIVKLNPNHSHYICVDNGTAGQFGVETNLRAELETFMSCFDNDARRMGVDELTHYFTACMDESALHIAGESCETGRKCRAVELEPERPTFIPVVRTASDGVTKASYTLRITKTADAHDKNQLLKEAHSKLEPEPEPSMDDDTDEAAQKIQKALTHSLEGRDLVSLKVSDSDLDFLPTEPFDPSKFEYDVEVPLSANSVSVIATLRRDIVDDIKLTTPIVMLCYGGGPISIKTLVAAGDKPIIIIKGSQRTAKYVEDWCNFEQQKKRKRNDPVAVERLTQKQMEIAEADLRRDIAGANRTTYEAVENLPVKPPWWNVDSFTSALEKLGRHDYMHFFDINQTATVNTTKKIRLNPMLPMLLGSIVKSTQVKSTVKLPLAIRLNHEDDVKTLCDAHGIALAQPQHEISQDSRLLIFAAFNDQGKVVERLLDAGFELQQLDCLVALEIQRDLERPQMMKADRPPEWWVNSQFQAGADPALVSTRWRRVDDKESIYRAISWQNMPSLPGWTMMVETISPDRWWPHAMIIQQLSSQYLDGELPPNGKMKRTFMVVSPRNMAGKMLSSVDEDVTEKQSAGHIIPCVIEDSSKDGKTQVVHCELYPLYKDNVTEWLPLESQCKFRLPIRRQATERRRVLRSFAQWLHHDTTAVTGDDADAKNKKQEYFPNRPMHALHRLYWAIRSNRPRLATVLMTRCKQPILAGIFSAQIYKRQILPADFVPDARLKPKYLPKAMQKASEEYACEILDNAELDGSNSAFDSFVFYGIDEEDGDEYIDFVTKESDQNENANVRMALHLMGVDPRCCMTNIDLALLASNKQFMTQNGVMQFLLKLWSRPSDNGNWVQRRLPYYLQIPRTKGVLNLIGSVSFLVLYIFFLSNIPPRAEEFPTTASEVFFWAWTLTFVVNEVFEAIGDFESFADYAGGRGNMIDICVITLFLAAFIFRLANWTGGQQLASDWMYAVLCGNLVLTCLRFLHQLAMFERIGVMLIIVGKIVHHDIAPFIVFAATTITAFESASMFFSWVLGVEHHFGHFFQTFTGVGTVKQESDEWRDPDVPAWDFGDGRGGQDIEDVQWLSTGFQLVFFLLSIVILMNLLIAMMADTYSTVATNSLLEYQMQFANIVKECYETTVFPVPLNAIEHLINRIMDIVVQRRSLAPSSLDDDSSHTTLNWGRHYTWPASSLPFQLEMAMRKVQVKKETEKALRKAKGGGGDYMQ